MPHFAYKARSASGELVQGVMESADAGGAASLLFGRGVTPVDITPARAPAAAGPAWWRVQLVRERIRLEEIMFFSRQMYTLLKAGVPIMRALGGLQESTTNGAFVQMLRDIRDTLDEGHDLATALARHPKVFSSFYVNMVRVGEMTGRLEEIFLRMFHHLEFDKFMREQVRSAVRYPSFVLATMAVALVVVNLFVIPAFAKVYKGFNAKLPAMTQLLISFSDFMVAAWPALLVGTVGAFYGFRVWSRSGPGKLRWDAIKLKLPIMGKIVLKATLARFARSLALALRSGVPAVQALNTVAKTVDNDFVASKIEKMREGVERGESVLRTAVESQVFTPIVLQMVAVGEESGALDDLMQEVGEAYQREVEYELKTLSTQVEPI